MQFINLITLFINNYVNVNFRVSEKDNNIDIKWVKEKSLIFNLNC